MPKRLAPKDAFEEPGDQDIEQGEDEPRPARRGKLIRRLLFGGSLLLVAAAVGASAFLGWQLKCQHDLLNTERAALAVANDYAVVLTSIDSSKVDENYAKVLDGATGEFRDKYSQSAAQLRKLLVDNKAVSRSIVVDSAIKSATPNKVEVLLFIDRSISNVANPTPRVDRSRVVITLEHIANRWLASKVDIK